MQYCSQEYITALIHKSVCQGLLFPRLLAIYHANHSSQSKAEYNLSKCIESKSFEFRWEPVSVFNGLQIADWGIQNTMPQDPRTLELSKHSSDR